MPFCKRSFVLLLGSFLALPLCALDLTPSFIFDTKAAIALPNDKEEDRAGDLLLGDCSAEFKLDASQDAHSAFVDCCLLFDAIGANSSGIALDKDDEEHNFFFKFKEGWYDFNGGFWSIRVGRQITAWGAADGLQVADVLCPKDESKLLTSDYSDSRLGIDAVRLSYNGTILSADAYWIPFFTPSALPLSETNPLKSLMIPPAIPSIVAGQVFYIPIHDFTEDDITKPESCLKNGEYAGKISAYTPFADLSLYGYWGWDDEPIISYSITGLNSYMVPTGIALSGEYKKMAMLGADASIPIGPLVFRAEGAFFPGRYFSTNMSAQLLENQDPYVTLNEIIFLGGLDFIAGDWTITGQYYGDAVSGSRTYVDREGYLHQATLSIAKTFLGGNMELSVAGMMEFNDFSYVIQLSGSYDATDQLSFSLGANFFRPGPDEDEIGQYGTYEDLSCVTLGAKFAF